MEIVIVLAPLRKHGPNPTYTEDPTLSLRKLAIVQLAEVGCSDAEIQAVTNQSAAMVAYYRKKASRFTLSKNAQDRRDQNGNRT